MIDPGTGEVVVDPETGKPVEDPSQIEEWAENIRANTISSKPLPPGTVKTPDDIIQDLDELDRLASQNVAVLREADRTRRAAIRMHKLARAFAYRNAQGTVGDRDAIADRDTKEQWEIADNAEIAYEYAKGVARLVEGRASHVQTQSKQVETMYHLAGKGR